MFKYDDTPLGYDGLRDKEDLLSQAVLSEICEWFTFDAEQEETTAP